MILVDTNVVSEPMKTRGDPRVVDWLDRQQAETLFISTITVSEILFGVAALPAGRRRSRLGDAFEQESGGCSKAASCPSTSPPPAPTPD